MGQNIRGFRGWTPDHEYVTHEWSDLTSYLPLPAVQAATTTTNWLILLIPENYHYIRYNYVYILQFKLLLQFLSFLRLCFDLWSQRSKCNNIIIILYYTVHSVNMSLELVVLTHVSLSFYVASISCREEGPAIEAKI